MPVFNSSFTIGHCLEGIAKSSYKDYECIVVDDSSDDDTAKIVTQFDVNLIRLGKRGGAAHARNRGAERAKGEILLFIDSDVVIASDCLSKIAQTFSDNPGIAAVFGSYDDQPERPNFLSQYRNLLHHYIHQTSQMDASTFWTGCGAVTKEAFFSVSMFNENTRMMEDIELGYRLKAKDYQIRLNKEILVKHLKHYSFSYLIKSDLFDRAIPWTALMFQNRQNTKDLNLKSEHKTSAVILFLAALSAALAIKWIWFLIAVPFLMLLFLVLNLDIYRFFLKRRGWFFALRVIPFHSLYYLYSSLGFGIGAFGYVFKKYTKQS
ncbi:glycosyltransferase [Acidobacteriota bacterium]